jgi:hypothetical protein
MYACVRLKSVPATAEIGEEKMITEKKRKHDAKTAHATAEIGEKTMIIKTSSVAAPGPPKRKRNRSATPAAVCP